MARTEDSFEKARDYAFLLLKFRLRSVSELSFRLKKKKFSDETIKKVTSFLKEKKFIDDNLFAKSWVNSRLKRSLGLRKIRSELKEKGIKNEVIEATFGAISNYSEEETVKQLAKERLSKIKDVDEIGAKRRVYAYLIRRGFSPDIVINTLKNKCGQIA